VQYRAQQWGQRAQAELLPAEALAELLLAETQAELLLAEVLVQQEAPEQEEAEAVVPLQPARAA